jgi:hypothetical protein
MGIKQLNGGYVAAEDRILLRISTDAREELRFWLTRPITGKLRAAIHAAAARTIAQKYPPQVAQAVAEFEQEAVQAQTRLDDEFLPGAILPLGEAPALVVKLTAVEKADALSLDLVLSNGKNVNLCLPRRLAQQVGVLLDQLQKNASWQLPEPGAPAAAASDAGDIAATNGSREKKLLH